MNLTLLEDAALVALVAAASRLSLYAAPGAALPVPIMLLLVLAAIGPWLIVRYVSRVRLEVPAALPACAFVVAMLLSYLVNGCPASGYALWLRHAAGAALFVMLAGGSGGPRAARAARWGLVLAGAWLAVDVLWAQVPRLIEMGGWLQRGIDLPFANALGGVLACALVLVLAAGPERGWLRMGSWLLALALAGALALTLSRASWLGAAAGLVAVAWARRRLGGQAVLAAVLFTAAFAAILDPSMINRSLESIPLRLGAWGDAVEMAASAPLLGVGPGRYPYEFPVFVEDLHRYAYMSAHNLYLMLAAETGLLGLLAFLAVPAALLPRLLRLAEASHEARAAVGTLTALAVHGIFHEDLFWVAPCVLLLWSVLGHASAAAREEA